MHDKKSTDPELQRLRQRVDVLEQLVRQLASARQPKITLPPHGPLICTSSEDLVAGDTIDLEILVFDEDEELVPSEEICVATDIFLDDADGTIEEGTKMIVEWIDGRDCITGIFNQPLQVHRGLTDEDIDKGDSGSVSRYIDGTDDDSGETDEIQNDYIDVGTGKSVMYITLGGVKYLFAVECPPE